MYIHHDSVTTQDVNDRSFVSETALTAAMRPGSHLEPPFFQRAALIYGNEFESIYSKKDWMASFFQKDKRSHDLEILCQPHHPRRPKLQS